MLGTCTALPTAEPLCLLLVLGADVSDRHDPAGLLIRATMHFTTTPRIMSVDNMVVRQSMACKNIQMPIIRSTSVWNASREL